MNWQLLTAVSVVSLSVSVLLQRVLLRNQKTDPYAYTVVFQGLIGVVLMVFAVIRGFTLPGIEKVWLPAIISIVAFGLGQIVYAKTLQVVEASAFSVLFATQAVWIMLLGVTLFHESLTVVQILGTLLIFASVLLLAQNIRKLGRQKGTILGLITGLIFGVAVTSWSYVGRHTDGISWAAISFVGTALVAYLTRPQSVRHMPQLLKGAILPKMVLLSLIYATGSVSMLYAYRYGAFSIVTPLRQTSIIVTVLLALLFLARERNRIRIKIAAAVVCFLGVLLVIV